MYLSRAAFISLPVYLGLRQVCLLKTETGVPIFDRCIYTKSSTYVVSLQVYLGLRQVYLPKTGRCVHIGQIHLSLKSTPGLISLQVGLGLRQVYLSKAGASRLGRFIYLGQVLSLYKYLGLRKVFIYIPGRVLSPPANEEFARSTVREVLVRTVPFTVFFVFIVDTVRYRVAGPC